MRLRHAVYRAVLIRDKFLDRVNGLSYLGGRLLVHWEP